MTAWSMMSPIKSGSRLWDMGSVLRRAQQPNDAGTHHLMTTRAVRVGTTKRFVLVALFLAGCASPSPTTNVLEGTILLTDDAWGSAHLDGPCEGEGGYGDIRGGADVVVRNQAGDIIATSSLQTGTLMTRTECEFTFTVDGVPAAAFYAIEVSHRGELTYSAAEMEQMDWRVALTLGDS